MGRLAILAWAFLGLLLLSADAQPQRRVALVIGNGTYAEAGTLANPVNDALDIADKLRSIGFEVIEGNDLGKRELERSIGAFSDALQGAGVGLFYYAGHGLQVDGRNYIVPVDARLDVPVKLQLEAVPIDEVLDIMEQQTKVSLVFLDACRNNPFARSLSRTATTRSAKALAGLAQFDSTRGSFIAFSTAPGAVAMDGSGRNSPFAAALLRHIAEPGQSINDMMIAVRRDVVSQTRETQRPWEAGIAARTLRIRLGRTTRRATKAGRGAGAFNGSGRT
ncbi:caspase domain-containing protein [Mesorhizobium sp. M7A.F.Ca.ET.027.03.2.1]|uniref:caspase family protein n=1 Tax=Mesorhizobium sp. M7A.F.Ca.ET.027.03.2.1 TaxID=2496656 RepID=UPI001FDED4A0|nr:caspase domain-containing protein [Mesorhizobium sp. M7A.F.Ca.ET.027.03.2.1]